MLDRALAFLWAVAESCADEVTAVAAGSVLRTPSLPDVRKLNALRIEDDHVSLGADDLRALADEHLGDLSFRRIDLEHSAAARRLDGPLCAAGWSVDRDAVMGLDRPADRIVDTAAVRAVGMEEILTLLAAWYVEDGKAADLQQLLSAKVREHRARPEHRFVVDAPPGRPAAMATLRWHAATAQIEDVYTLPDARGRGHARTVLTHALRVAQEHGHTTIFIIADADDTPKELYARLGFSEIGRRLSARVAVPPRSRPPL